MTLKYQPLEISEKKHYFTAESASHVGNITKVEKTKSGLDCAFLCLKMPQGSCLSFNFGRIATNGLHICELSNSERALEPHKLLNRTSFVYYGMKMSVSIIFKGERSFLSAKYFHVGLKTVFTKIY